MKLLVLGGTRFAGRHLVELALSRGHEVTLFHRGKTNPGLFPGTEEVLGDRDGGLSALPNRSWDAVLDFCGYVPRIVRQSVERLRGVTSLYVFVSTVSVYADTSQPGVDEGSPLAAPAPGQETTEEVTGETYGWLKVLCEREVEEGFPGRSLIARPGLLVGPLDYTGRFNYWPWRLARGGEVLAPGRPGRTVQVVDARDLAAWLLGMAERGRTGLFNVTGPDRKLTMGEVLETCRDAAGSASTFTWVDEPFLLENGVEPFTELPLWLPESEAGFGEIDNRRAIAEGLTFRPLLDTARDTLAWMRSEPGPPLGRSLAREREAELLRHWRERFC